ncbi:possible high light inducible protein [Prochlorococcus marinus str. MIT 9515]|uniref:Possible high light inducible protein n=1 Tax=Prochlorococcus marinus (strain MIT 9515) TaxID=167542 RepID=A2BWD6_PROM5|nr:chlorophyll a/b-binding protein [Prochlorococcus marinus]ABM72097.1 Possible high light inducible protein [Prochlorococcus marinus str. MIT 9515]ABM72954.1 possible high light inducible protein [Prochlorococcus marinus str. MIT 9515]
MSPLADFLIFIVSLTALLVAYLAKQFQEENLIYSNKNQMTNTETKTKTKTKTIEKEKVVAETLNGRFAMIGLIAAVGAYLTTGQIIPGFV